MGRNASFSVEPGMKGILISCFRKRESACVLEAYNLFDQFYEIPDRSNSNEQASSDAREIPVEEQVENELKMLRNKKEKSKPFLNIPLGDLECLVFIKTCPQIRPSTFVQTVLDDALANKIRKTRYCHRMIPLDASCYANMTDLKKTFELFISEYFSASQPSKTYCLLIESRFNSSLSKDEIIRELPAMIPSIHQVKFYNPDLTVVIQIFKNICAISILKDYARFKKYNIQQCLLGKQNSVVNILR